MYHYFTAINALRDERRPTRSDGELNTDGGNRSRLLFPIFDHHQLHRHAMFNMLVHTHSGLRWVALLLLLITAFKALAGWLGNKPYQPLDRKLATFTVISVHLQLVIGLVLYFMSPTVTEALADFGGAMKVPALRFFALEHLLGMVVAIAFVTIGSASAKRATADVIKHKRVAVWFLLGLLLIIALIPWPFRADGIARSMF